MTVAGSRNYWSRSVPSGICMAFEYQNTLGVLSSYRWEAEAAEVVEAILLHNPANRRVANIPDPHRSQRILSWPDNR